MEKYLKVLYELGSSVESESAAPAMPVTPMTPTTPAREEDDDDDDEMRKVLLGLVLRRLMIQEQVEVKLEERFAQYQHVSASSPCEA